MSNFIQVIPFMHVDNIDRALTFFTDILGFKTLLRASDYALASTSSARWST